MWRKLLPLCFASTLILLASCASKISYKKVLLKPSGELQVRTFPVKSLDRATVRYVTLEDVRRTQARRGIPVSYGIVEGKSPFPPYTYIGWKVVKSPDSIPEESYPVFANVCKGRKVIEGKEVLNCPWICYLDSGEGGNCLDLGFLPSPIAYSGSPVTSSEFDIVRFFFYEPWIDVQREEILFLKENELCRWRYLSGILRCERLEGNHKLPNPSFFMSGLPDVFYVASNPGRCFYESSASTIFSLNCDVKDRHICLYKGNKRIFCGELPLYLDILETAYLTDGETLLITEQGVLRKDLSSGVSEVVHEGYAWISFGSCDSERGMCSYFLETTPRGYIYAVGRNIYKDVVYTRLADILFGSEYEMAIKSRSLFDPPVVMNTILVKCEKGGIVWKFAEELLRRFERTLPPQLISVGDLRKAIDNLRLGVEVSREVSNLLVDLKNRKSVDLNTFRSLLRRKVKDKEIREVVISAVYYAGLLNGGIKIEEGELCSTPYYLRVGLVNLVSRDIYNNSVPIPLEMNSAGIPYSFKLLPFKLGGRYLILLITNTDPVVEAGGISFKVLYVLLSPEGKLLSYREEKHRVPARPVECFSESDLQRLPTLLMYFPEEVRILSSGEIKAGLCRLRANRVEELEKALRKLPRRFLIREVDGLKVLQVVRAGGEKEIYDLYFRRIEMNGEVR